MKTIVLRLVGGRDEGAWFVVDDEPTRVTPLRSSTDSPLIDVHIEALVTTGSVEWHGDTPAEVYVPVSKLALWRAEHDVDEEA